MNVVTLVGTLVRPAELRVLQSGDQLVSYQVRANGDADKPDTVPVVWFNAPASASTLDVDERVVVLGRVRRRFFRGQSGVTESRTEVVADAVVPVRHAKRAQAVLESARNRLGLDT